MSLQESQPSQPQIHQCIDLLPFIQVLAIENQEMPQSLFYLVFANTSVALFPHIFERGPHFCFSWYIQGSTPLSYIVCSSSVHDVSKAILPPAGLGLGGACMWAQACLTPCGQVDCNIPGSSVHGISQATVLEWVAISFSRDLLNPGIKFTLLSLQHWQAMEGSGSS